MGELSELAQAEINELISEGYELSHADIVHLNDLARNVEHPSGGSTLPAGRPAQAGHLWLWPFTAQSESWYATTLDWFDGNQKMELIALAYAMAYARVPGAYDELYSYAAARKALKKWWSTISCTVDELSIAISDILEQMTRGLPEVLEDEAKGEATDWADIVASLCVSTGCDPEVWTCRVSKNYLLAQLNAIAQQHRAEGDPPSACDPKIRAEQALGVAILAIKKRGQDGRA